LGGIKYCFSEPVAVEHWVKKIIFLTTKVTKENKRMGVIYPEIKKASQFPGRPNLKS
jgi:hypothetical protein